MLGRLKSALRGSSDTAEVPKGPPQSTTVQRLNELVRERDRVISLAEAEEERQDALGEQIKRKDSGRIDALTEARLNGRDVDRERADALSTESAALRMEIEESAAVADRLRAQAGQLNGEIDGLRATIKQGEAPFLDDLYAKLISSYNAQAHELAETVLQIAAVRRVMMDRRAGNSNGWDGVILLPGMHAKRGIENPPMLDGASPQFDAAANQRAADIADRMRAVGFMV